MTLCAEGTAVSCWFNSKVQSVEASSNIFLHNKFSFKNTHILCGEWKVVLLEIIPQAIIWKVYHLDLLLRYLVEWCYSSEYENIIWYTRKTHSWFNTVFLNVFTKMYPLHFAIMQILSISHFRTPYHSTIRDYFSIFQRKKTDTTKLSIAFNITVTFVAF